MKTLELNEVSLTDLSKEESTEINGGVFGLDDLLIGIAIGAAVKFFLTGTTLNEV